MTDKARPKARLPRGFADRGPAEIRRVHAMTETIRGVFERWGFEPVETPLIEFADALGKFLPDQDRPNEGVFAFQDDDEQWLSLRYDLTAPLARMVAENFERTPKPYKSYRSGWVFRNEKPGPGRFRQFMQFDADIVGSASPLADAEICMMAADTMEALGFARGDYVIRVNSRKVLDGAIAALRVADKDPNMRLRILRSLDKADKLSKSDVQLLLMGGRKDESGDFTAGAGLDDYDARFILQFTEPLGQRTFQQFRNEIVHHGETSRAARIIAEFAVFEGYRELEIIEGVCRAAGYAADRIVIDPSVVRGLEYYTGAVFEAELRFETTDEQGRPQKFGSVGGGGRYDGLVGRFRGENVPATGFSVGVSRLAAALAARDKDRQEHGPVVVTVMDKAELGRYQALTTQLRAALNPPGGKPVPVEMYIGESGMKAQLKYADRRNAPCVIIEGSDERARGKVQIKDLAAGKVAAEGIADREAWVAARPAQREVDSDVQSIAAAVREIIG